MVGWERVLQRIEIELNKQEALNNFMAVLSALSFLTLIMYVSVSGPYALTPYTKHYHIFLIHILIF